MTEFSSEFDVTGIIMPHDWDKTGRIVEIALYTDKEEVYTLEHSNFYRKLIKLMHKRVAIKGNVRVRGDGKKLITAREYIIIDEIMDEK